MSVVVQVPVKFKRHGVRRLIIAPETTDDQTLSASNVPDPVLVAALVRAHRWQRMIEDGLIGNIERLAEKEGISSTFISRTLRLNTLAPDIKCAILTGTQPKTLRLSTLMSSVPDEWEAQRSMLMIVSVSEITHKF